MSKTPVTNEKKNIHYGSVAQISQLIQQRQLSPVEIVESCLKRIEELNPKLNAFITVVADEAREQAKIAEEEIRAGKWRGPLHGIPIGIKDFYDTAGIKTTAAFEHFRDRIPSNDAPAVTTLKAAGAIILGKTNMHQLGMGTTGLDSYFGPVKNPWNPDYIPGGSSSGSAVAVSTDMCYATLDTDAIGSCRLPAACCGVVGFKGTYGLISPQGILEGEQPPDEFIVWMNHPGITARGVQDIALMLDVLASGNEHHIGNFAFNLAKAKKLQIGIANNFHAAPEVLDAFETAIEIVRSFNHSISGISIPFGDPSRGIANIEADRKAITGQLFKDIDIVLLPTTATTVPMVKDIGSDHQGLSPENTAFANYYGLPAITIPCGFDSNGLPLGLQVVGKPWNEASILSLAYQFQEATLWNQKHPNL